MDWESPTVFASAGLGAVTGSSVAAVATLGEIALPELKRHRYDPRFSVGTIAAAGTLGILIPPSIPMVLYGLLAEESIGRPFCGRDSSGTADGNAVSAV